MLNSEFTPPTFARHRAVIICRDFWVLLCHVRKSTPSTFSANKDKKMEALFYFEKTSVTWIQGSAVDIRREVFRWKHSLRKTVSYFCLKHLRWLTCQNDKVIYCLLRAHIWVNPNCSFNYSYYSCSFVGDIKLTQRLCFHSGILIWAFKRCIFILDWGTFWKVLTLFISKVLSGHYPALILSIQIGLIFLSAASNL